MANILVLLVIVGLILAAALGVGVIVLIKMGVIAKYALKEEAPDQGEYGIDQSREAE